MGCVCPFILLGLLSTLISCSGNDNTQISIGAALYEQLENITNDTVHEVCRSDLGFLIGWFLYNACVTECSKRNLDCDLRCPCRNGGRCKPDLEVCQCAPGWWGNFCQYPCEDGFYGDECNSRCQCNEDEFCDFATGRCDENSLKIDCRETPYDSLCRGRCDCPRGTVCSVVNGSCTCPGRCTVVQPSADYCPECHIMGEICFDSGTWNGNICNRCKDVQNLTCIPTCEDGWKGVFCRVCQEGRYGSDCRNMCKCGEGAVCEPETGQCICGKGCSQRCRRGFYGRACEQRCDCPSGVPCTDDTGMCTCPVGNCGIEGPSKGVTVGGVFVGIAIVLIISGIAIIVRYKIMKIFQLRKFPRKFEEANSVTQSSRPLSYQGETCSLASGYKSPNRNSHYERSIQSSTLPPLPPLPQSPVLHHSSRYNTAQGRTSTFTTAPPNQQDARLYEDPESICNDDTERNRKSAHGEELDVNSRPEDDQGMVVINSDDANETPQYFELEKPI